MVVIVAIFAGILGAWAGYRAARGFPVLSDDLLAAGVVELVMLVQVVVVIVLVVQRGASDPVLLWGYLGAGFVLLPFAGAWAFAERTRWSSVILSLAALSLVVVEWRLTQIWGG
jgi:hypothetical protein